MKNFLSILVLSFLACTARATVVGGHDGNGGAGICKGSYCKTFYEAHINVVGEPKDEDDIPGLSALIQTITSSGLFTISSPALLQGIVPTSERNYYDIAPEELSPANIANILKAYKNATGQALDINDLFAITYGKNTFFFPSFYKLSASGQQAILFHEAMWVLYPTMTYKAVIEVEKNFQAYLANPLNTDAGLYLLTWAVYFYPGQVLAYGMTVDLQSGVLTSQGVFHSKLGASINVTPRFLFGNEWAQCVLAGTNMQTGLCGSVGSLSARAEELVALYPESALFKALRLVMRYRSDRNFLIYAYHAFDRAPSLHTNFDAPFAMIPANLIPYDNSRLCVLGWSKDDAQDYANCGRFFNN